MVKKATTKKTGKNVGGRPKRDPNTLRTERLVIRIHPDLMNALTDLARSNGITRSLLVERAMISFVNMSAKDATPFLDFMGRALTGRPAGDQPLGTLQSFQQVWKKAVGGTYTPPTTNVRPPGWEPLPSDISGNPEDDGI
jgi:predicted transcriptional regulator